MVRALPVYFVSLVLAVLVTSGGIASGAEPGALDTLARLAEHHRQLGAFRAAGSLEVEVPGEPTRRFQVRVLRGSDGGFRLDLERVAGPDDTFPWKVLWRPPGDAEEGDVYHWDADRGQVKVSSSLAAEVEDDLFEVWPVVSGLEALPGVALLLDPRFLTDTPAATFDGEEPCGGATSDAAAAEEPCRLLVLSRRGGRVETLLLVDDQHRIRRSEVLLRGPPGPGGGAEPRWRFDLRWGSMNEDAARDEVGRELAFVPPTGTVWGERWQEGGEPFGVAGGEGSSVETPLAAFRDSIEVGLLSLPVRVLDAADRPIRDLAPEDFRVTVRVETAAGDTERREVPVVNTEWVGHGARLPPGPTERPEASEVARRGSEEGGERLPGDEAPDRPLRQPWKQPGEEGGGDGEPPERRLVILVQSDVHAVRTRGHLKFLPWLEELLEGLPAAEPVAVLGFDSHLKLFQDFTLDRKRIHDAVWEAVHFGARPGRPRGRDAGPLARVLDFAAAKDAATPEQALRECARALGQLAGSEELIWIGWGMGTFRRGAVSMGPGWGDLHQALAAADVRVSVLDVTDAAAHTLELGLRRVADATGGTYAKTAEFPRRAVRSLVAVLSGHWLLHLDVGGLEAEVPGTLEVRLVGRPGQVLLGPAAGGSRR